MAVKREKIFVDAINEDRCTVLVGSSAFSVDLPVRMLPSGTSEGDWLILTLQRSERLNRSGRRSLEKLLEKLE